MADIRVLHVRFRFPIPASQLPAFRGAIASESGFRHILFHNHVKNGFRYKYPLIQYKRIASCPALVCINDGVDEVYEFFRKRKRKLRLNGEPYPVEIADIHLKTWKMGQNGSRHRYRISNWMALNQYNYARYREASGEQERQELLESILIGNIKSMGKGLGVWFEKDLELNIETLPEMRNGRFKGKNVCLFRLEFSCNVSIPNFLGLGKGVSSGHGILYHLQRTPEEKHKQSINRVA